jgi:hypothetical protein
MALPTRRAVMSAAEPGGKPMIRWIGRDGGQRERQPQYGNALHGNSPFGCGSFFERNDCRKTGRVAVAFGIWRSNP